MKHDKPASTTSPSLFDTWVEQLSTPLEDLATQLDDGMVVQPLYTKAQAHPTKMQASFLRASADHSEVCQLHTHPDVAVTEAAIRDDTQNGVRVIQVHLDKAFRAGLDADAAGAEYWVGRQGVALSTAADFRFATPDITFQWAAGPQFLISAAMAVAHLSPEERQQIAWSFDADPWGTLAQHGSLPSAASAMLEMAAELAQWTHENAPQSTSLLASGAIYRDSGATVAQSLGYMLATAHEYIEALSQRGLSLEAAARQIRYVVGNTADVFMGIASVRAMRVLVSYMLQSAGAKAIAKPRIDAETSRRIYSARSPYTNVLRATASTLASVAGGAETILVYPFDTILGLPTASSRRLARNTLLILQNESGLDKAVDPVGGAWYAESLTHDLIDTAWVIFKQVYEQGGMLRSLQSGLIHEQIEAARLQRERRLAHRRQVITGISDFAVLNEAPWQPPRIDYDALLKRRRALLQNPRPRPSLRAEPGRFAQLVDLARGGATVGMLAQLLGTTAGVPSSNDTLPKTTPLPLLRDAALFERFRDQSDAYLNDTGARPQVFLAQFGSLAETQARKTFAQNICETGGILAIDRGPHEQSDAVVEAFRTSAVKSVIICSSDKKYTEYIQSWVLQLQNAGAEFVMIAGKPSAIVEQAGVQLFLYQGCDVLQALDVLWNHLPSARVA